MSSQLASQGYKTSFLNPSDCIAVMQGCIGYGPGETLTPGVRLRRCD